MLYFSLSLTRVARRDASVRSDTQRCPCGRVVKTDRPMGGPETRSNFIQSTRVGCAGGNAVRRVGRAAAAGRGGKKTKTAGRVAHSESAGPAAGGRVERKLKKLRAQSTPIKVRAGRAPRFGPAHPGPVFPVGRPPGLARAAARPPAHTPRRASKTFPKLSRSSLPFLH